MARYKFLLFMALLGMILPGCFYLGPSTPTNPLGIYNTYSIRNSSSSPTSTGESAEKPNYPAIGPAKITPNGIRYNDDPVAQLGPGAVGTGIIASDVNYPNFLQPNDVQGIELTSHDIEIIGRFNAEGDGWRFGVGDDLANIAQNFSALGLPLKFLAVSKGQFDYGKMVKELKKKHDVDGILNLTVNTQYYSILPSISPLNYKVVHIQISGNGYRLRK